MKTRTNCMLLALAALLGAGCWQKSVNPFYTAQDVIFDPKLLGSWDEQKDDPNEKHDTWIFTKSGDKQYELEMVDADKNARHYDVHLFKLDGHQMLDLMARERSISSIPAHHLLAVDELGGSMKLRLLSREWIAEWLKEHPDSLRHIIVNDPEKPTEHDKDDFILTAETKELQKFVRAHFNDEKFFTDATAFRRRTASSEN